MSQSREVTARDLRASGRRRPRRGRRIAAGALALAAFAAGAFVGVRSQQHPFQRVAARYTAAWESGDWARMWAMSSGPRRPGPARFGARQPDALVGVSGLQRVFDERLLGHPGGILYAGRRVLASTPARAGRPVRTTISPRVQRAAVDALAGRLGGAIALRPRTGEILGAAGVA